MYIWLIRIGLIRTESDQFQEKVLNAYSVFNTMSKLTGINSVSFNNGKCVINLVDQRKYIFNPFIRASRLYSVPKTGTFEKKETEYLTGLIHEGFVCIDIGASFGWYTIILSKLVGQKGHIYAFEPLPENYSVLVENIKENQLKNVTTFTVALGDTKKSAKLYLPDVGVSGSLKLHKFRNNYDEINCEIDTFDSIVEKECIEKIDFIKADIEGGEYAFLKGAINSIKKFMPFIMLEIQENSTKLFGYEPNDIFSLLEDLNYKAYYIGDNKDGDFNKTLHLLAQTSDQLPDYNFLFVPENRRVKI